jgi:hypothetical protein
MYRKTASAVPPKLAALCTQLEARLPLVSQHPYLLQEGVGFLVVSL